MIRKLQLNNFKKHKHVTFEFTEGLNGIFGPNYTGKTTILYAILFAIGGASHVPGTNLQRKGTNSGMGVTMEFDINGTEYKVERKKSGAYLYDNIGMIASGTSNVTAKMEELIGMPIKRFRQLKYAEQKKAHALLTAGATELHKILEELTGVDQINVALEKLKSIIDKAIGSMEALSYEEPVFIEENIAEAKAHVEELTGEVAQLDEEATIIRDKMTEANEQVSVLEENQSRHQKYSTEKARITASIHAQSENLRAATERVPAGVSSESIQSNIAEYSKLEQALEKAIGEVWDKEQELEAVEKEYSHNQHFIRDTSKVIEGLEQDIADVPSDVTEKRVEEVEAKVELLKSQENEAQLRFSDLIKMQNESSCPLCNREFEGAATVTQEEIRQAEDLVDDLAKNRKEVQNELTRLRSLLSVVHVSRDALKQNWKALTEATAKDELLSSKVTELANELKELRPRSDLKDELKRAQTDGNEWRMELKQLERNWFEIEQANEKLKDLDQELHELVPVEFDEADLKAARERRQNVIDASQTVADRLNQKKGDLAEWSSDLRSYQEQLDKVKVDNEKYDKAKRTHSTAKELQKFLRTNRDRYTADIWSYFLGSASTFASDCTNGTITAIGRTEGGQFYFKEGEDSMGIKDASGAQESIMGLAVQVALAQAAQSPLDVLLMDEPTADMDADHSMAVAGLLATKGSQVIAISHREMDASLCNNVINLGV